MMAFRSKQKILFLAFSVGVMLPAIISCSGGGYSASPPWPSIGVRIENNSGWSRNPKIAADNTGTAIVVWEQFDFSRVSAWANHYDGTAWGTAVPIETDNPGSVKNLQIAMDDTDTGTAFAVWEQSNNTHHNLWINRFNGAVWGTAVLIETAEIGIVHYDRFPQIVMNGTGSVIVLWRQWDGSRFNSWIKIFDGAAWGTALLIETNNAGSAENPQIAMDGTGGAIVVWEQSDGVFKHIWANRFDGTAWGTPELIETASVGDAQGAKIAIDDTGRALVLWRQYDGIRWNIWANRFDGTAWGTAGLIETDNAGNAGSPQIAMDSTGSVIAVWVQDDGLHTNLLANRFDGMAWGAAELIETDNTGDVGEFKIAMDGTGSIVAVWSQYNGTRYSLWSNHFNGAVWGSAKRIENNSSGTYLDSEIAMDHTGTAFAVWEQSDGTRQNIWVNRFDGVTWDTARRMEMDNAEDIASPQIAMDGTGRALVVLQQAADDLNRNLWAYCIE